MNTLVHINCLRLGRALAGLILLTSLAVGCVPDTPGEHAECADGATREITCGSFGNGTLTQTCVDFRWEDDGFCEDSNECAPGTVRPIVCGINGNGEGTEECNNGVWVELETCNDPDVCENGVPREVACGVEDAGFQEEICTDGQWAVFGECINELECELDEIDRRECGLNMRGVEERGCDELFMWEEEFGLCADPDVCVDGSLQEARCYDQLGMNGHEMVRTRSCVNGQWGEFGECADADECVIGDAGLVACGDDGSGIQTRVCESGEWNFGEYCHQTMSDILSAPYGLLMVNDGAHSKVIGSNVRSTLGVEGFDEPFAWLPIESEAPSPYRSGQSHLRFAASRTHQCAISPADRLHCWGDNSYGQLGPNGASLLETAAPVFVPVEGTPTQVIAGEGFSCALTSNGRVYCWGRNDEGQSGRIDSLNYSPQLTELLPAMTVRFLAAGEAHACAGNSDDEVYCWGRNTSKQVSPAANPSIRIPTKHAGLSKHPNGNGLLGATNLVGVYAGANHTLVLWARSGTLGLAPSTTLVGVGANDRGQLGDASTQPIVSAPVPLDSLDERLTNDRSFQIHANGDVTCIFQPQESAVRCTGDNRFGQISDSNDEFIAELVAAPSDLTSFGEPIHMLAVQHDAICVLLTHSRRVACRGGNTHGQLGDGTTISRPHSKMVLHPSSED